MIMTIQLLALEIIFSSILINPMLLLSMLLETYQMLLNPGTGVWRKMRHADVFIVAFLILIRRF